MHHTKDKGDLGVLKAKADLCQKGLMVLSPETEHAPFDLVVFNGVRFFKIQVKYRAIKRGALCVPMRSSWSDSNGVHIRRYSKDDFDVICIYCPDNDTCYYIKREMIEKDFAIRVEKSKNNQTVGVNLAEQFLDFPIFS
jgi:hypothetical protein